MVHAESARAGNARRLAAAVAVAVAVVVAAASAHASRKTLEECVEGSDFIANAARSRDNGMTREAFLERLDGDLLAIRAFPPALRWFARDEDDEQMLRRAARDVFDRPQPPARHAGALLAACLDAARA